ncbi:MAG: hypothetical protein VB078_07815 [Clostridiaceae bacterium]|nr:hypothetical protein [Clostridiaceae bacterium]
MASYNKDVDYRALIDKAASVGDYRTAAELEKQRNEKIAGEGMRYQTTSDYSGWLDKTDYGEKIQSAVNDGKSKQAVSNLLEKRVDKAGSTLGMGQWAYDDIYDMAMEYLATGVNAGTYQSSYSDSISELLDKLLSREAFSYDYESDPLYQSYAEVYGREGKRAMEDALGLSAQNTGGLASSYATAAAQQAGSYYGSQLAGKIPELYKLAYEVYLGEAESDVQNLQMLSELEQNEYQRHRDSVEDIYKDAELDYEKYLDELEAQRYDSEQQYKKSRDAVEDQRYDTEWQYDLDRDAIDDRRYEAQLAAKTPAKTSSSSKSSSSGRDDRKTEVSVYGLTGTYSLPEAEAMVAIGLAERVKEKRKTIYKIAAMN